MVATNVNKIPTVPLIKTIRGALRFVQNPLPVIDEALQDYGPTYITRIIGGQRLIMTTDADIIQHVLQGNHKNYQKSKIQTESLGKYVGQGLLTVNGPYWLRQRRLIQPGFHRSRLLGLIDIVADEVDLFCRDLQTRLSFSSDPSDVGDLMMELTLRVVSKALFSTGIDQEEIHHLGTLLTLQQEHIIREIRQPQWNWLRTLNGSMKAARERSERIRMMMRTIISDRQERDIHFDDLLGMLLDARYEDSGSGMTPTQLIDETIILYVAGHETTATALSWCLYEIARHPEIYQQAKATAADLLSQPWDLEAVMSNDILQQVIYETMRLYPPAWILDRQAIDSDDINGLAVSRGDLMGLYVYGTHRDPRYWERPLSFDPTRFADHSHGAVPKFAFLPFGGGPRLCIGNQFAMLEMKMALAALLHRFSWDASLGDVHPRPMITLRPECPIKMQVSSP